MTETTVLKQGRFKPGQSGNPAGRPKGSRHATTVAIEALLDGEAEAITRKAIEAAKAGDMVAIRLVMDRICPPRKTRPVHIELPPIADTHGVADAQPRSGPSNIVLARKPFHSHTLAMRS